MTEPIRFTPSAHLEAQENLAMFVDFARAKLPPLSNQNYFNNDAWCIDGNSSKGSAHRFIYFCQLHVNPLAHRKKRNKANPAPAEMPEHLMMRQPFKDFAKAMIIHLHIWKKTVALSIRIAAFRYLEAALYEVTSDTCPTAVTPEVLNHAANLAMETVGGDTASSYASHLALIYRNMIELGLVRAPDIWTPSVPKPRRNRSRVGKQFDDERAAKLPSALALDALSEIFSSDNSDPSIVFTSSICAIMLCAPERSVEALFSPIDLIAPDWTDPLTGEVGTGLRWFPVKGAKPFIKTVIPSMREIAVRAVARLLELSEPARVIAKWYEKNPSKIYLHPNLEYLREHELLSYPEVSAILFGSPVNKATSTDMTRTRKWLNNHSIYCPKAYKLNKVIPFSALEDAALADLPIGFPVMDHTTGMRYSEALCIARISEFRSKVPLKCSFDRISYSTLKTGLKSSGKNKSIFEKLNYRDSSERFLSISTHMLRHYLDTLVRHSGALSEEEVAKWAGRMNIRQNATYNHESDRNIIDKLRSALGDPSRAVGPFSNIGERNFIRRDEFANIKIITAHTTEHGYCIHDYAQTPCQVHQDCMNCDEQVCIKGDERAERNLRQTQAELIHLQDLAREAYRSDVLGAAEWFLYQEKTLERVNQLISIFDDSNVPHGSIIQLNGVVPASRLKMAEAKRELKLKSIAKSITSLSEVHEILSIPEKAPGLDHDS